MSRAKYGIRGWKKKGSKIDLSVCIIFFQNYYLFRLKKNCDEKFFFFLSFQTKRDQYIYIYKFSRYYRKKQFHE